MKKIISLLVAAVLLITVATTGFAAPPQQTAVPAGMQKMLSNAQLELYVNQNTGFFAVRDLRDNSVWLSNPADSTADQMKVDAELVRIAYKTEDGIKGELSSYEHSVLGKGVSIKKEGSKVVATYIIGENVKLGTKDLPKALTKERFDEIIARFENPDDQSSMYDRYEEIIPEIIEYLDPELSREYLQYLSKNNGQPFVALKAIQEFAAEELATVLYERGGYTASELAEDNAHFGIVAAETAQKSVTVSLELSLDGDALLVDMPCEKIVASGGIMPTSIELLNFFGAAKQSEAGYTFIPDGSGALIYHSTNRPDRYSATPLQLYGRDRTMKTNTEYMSFQPVVMPVFGINRQNAGVLGIITKGSGVASVRYGSGAGQNNYNTVSSEYNLLPTDIVNMGSGDAAAVSLYPKEIYRGEIQVRYCFLGDMADKGYVGMAQKYRKYLQATGQLAKPQNLTATPVNVELIGAIRKKTTFLGLIPYTKSIPLTTFDQAAEIVKDLQASGISNLNVRYSGWQKGGLETSITDKAKPDSVLGGTGKLKEFIANMKAANVNVYFDTNALSVRNGNGISPKTDGTRHLGEQLAVAFRFDLPTAYKRVNDTLFYRLNATAIEKKLNKYIKKTAKLGIENLSFNDLGGQLDSDFIKWNYYSREDMKELVDGKLKELAANNKLMLRSPYDSAAQYAQDIVYAPIYSSQMKVTDQAVPFFSIVYHGYKTYSGQPINIAGNYKDEALRAIEAGAAPHFTLCYEKGSQVKDTEFDRYYSIDYKNWSEYMKNYCSRVEKELKSTLNQEIVRYTRLSEQVTKTTYKNGVSVLVNYSDKDYQAGATVVKAHDWAVEGGQGK